PRSAACHPLFLACRRKSMIRVSTITRCATTGSACGPLTDDSELTASWPVHNVTTTSGFRFLQRCTAPLGRTSEISEVRIISRPPILAQEQKGYRDASVLSRGGTSGRVGRNRRGRLN